MLALDDGKLMRVDISEENGQRVPYTMDEVIDLVCEWNYEQLEEARAVVDHPKDFAEYCEYKFTYDALEMMRQWTSRRCLMHCLDSGLGQSSKGH